MRLQGTAIRVGLFTAVVATLAMFFPEFVMAQAVQTGSVIAIVRTSGGASASDVRATATGADPAADSRDILSGIHAYVTVQRRGLGPANGTPDPPPPPPAQSGGIVFRGGGRGDGRTSAAATQPGGAWWTNAALVARLGLTEEQKKKIEAVFEQYRQALVQNKADLEREEAVLARMLEAEPMEPPRTVSSQIERVIQARAEMERTNSRMTLEIRQNLTRAQWVQLQTETTQLLAAPVIVAPGARSGGPRTGGPNVAPGSPR